MHGLVLLLPAACTHTTPQTQRTPKARSTSAWRLPYPAHARSRADAAVHPRRFPSDKRKSETFVSDSDNRLLYLKYPQRGRKTEAARWPSGQRRTRSHWRRGFESLARLCLIFFSELPRVRTHPSVTHQVQSASTLRHVCASVAWPHRSASLVAVQGVDLEPRYGSFLHNQVPGFYRLVRGIQTHINNPF